MIAADTSVLVSVWNSARSTVRTAMAPSTMMSAMPRSLFRWRARRSIA
ncbi:MAG: hypothetical protein U0235_29085 [Polyangiaceae bacterium]